MARGDQIYAYREFWNMDGVYEHHGIDCGDGTAIHYRKPSETIERTSLETFSRGQRIYIRSYPFRYIADTAILRAESRLGERKYNLLFNNCEHFATWCITGVSDSRQIRNFIPVLSQINVDTLNEPIAQALGEARSQNLSGLLNGALVDIKTAWDDIQPQYKEALDEMKAWHQVAAEAMRRNREDLAREALNRKLIYKRRARELEGDLKKLATLTEDLVRNRSDLEI
ncbi:MAG: lecithin retinol acyltransferase family protein [Limnospira sp.]